MLKNIIEIPMITFSFGNQRGYGIHDLYMRAKKDDKSGYLFILWDYLDH